VPSGDKARAREIRARKVKAGVRAAVLHGVEPLSSPENRNRRALRYAQKRGGNPLTALSVYL
jgi:hypothetical protein